MRKKTVLLLSAVATIAAGGIALLLLASPEDVANATATTSPTASQAPAGLPSNKAGVSGSDSAVASRAVDPASRANGATGRGSEMAPGGSQLTTRTLDDTALSKESAKALRADLSTGLSDCVAAANVPRTELSTGVALEVDLLGAGDDARLDKARIEGLGRLDPNDASALRECFEKHVGTISVSYDGSTQDLGRVNVPVGLSPPS